MKPCIIWNQTILAISQDQTRANQTAPYYQETSIYLITLTNLTILVTLTNLTTLTILTYQNNYQGDKKENPHWLFWFVFYIFNWIISSGRLPGWPCRQGLGIPSTSWVSNLDMPKGTGCGCGLISRTKSAQTKIEDDYLPPHSGPGQKGACRTVPQTAKWRCALRGRLALDRLLLWEPLWCSWLLDMLK